MRSCTLHSMYIDFLHNLPITRFQSILDLHPTQGADGSDGDGSGGEPGTSSGSLSSDGDDAIAHDSGASEMKDSIVLVFLQGSTHRFL